MTRVMVFLLLLTLALGCAVRPGTTVQTLRVVGEFAGPGLTADLVLQAFKFRFLNEDHHIDHVRLLEDDGSVRAFFADASPGDPWEFSAHYLAVAGIRTTEKEINCTSDQGFCDIDLGFDVASDEADGHRFALVGFEFQRIGGSDDHHIRSIGILPAQPEGNLLRVSFRDKSPENDEFRCLVQYKLIPFNRLSGLPVRWFVSGDNSRRIAGEMLGGEPDDRILSGFQFNYAGDDHHVLELGANVADGTVSFRDNNFDDLISWDIAYLQLEDE